MRKLAGLNSNPEKLMKTYPDCIPCFLRQSLEAARLVSDDPAFHEKILRRALIIASKMDYSSPPPAMGRDIHRLIRSLSGVEDPYHQAKVRSNEYILGLLPKLRKQVAESEDPFQTALRFAVAGNVIDFGVKIDLSESDIENALHQCLEAELDEEVINLFREALKNATSILYAGDNAGEIVFDRLFIETIQEVLGVSEITFAVRGVPILNDATLEDARQAGLHEVAEVISNGSDAPGNLLPDCSPQFHERLQRADLIISKGQGNYETLSELPQETYFLLKAKCAVIAREVGVREGDLCVIRKAGETESSAAGTRSN